jgi:hypothetical protein
LPDIPQLTHNPLLVGTSTSRTEEDMNRLYNITFKPHRRTSLLLANLGSVVVSAKNKESAKELGQAVVRDFYNGNEYMVKQYTYIVEREEI